MTLVSAQCQVAASLRSVFDSFRDGFLSGDSPNTQPEATRQDCACLLRHFWSAEQAKSTSAFCTSTIPYKCKLSRERTEYMYVERVASLAVTMQHIISGARIRRRQFHSSSKPAATRWGYSWTFRTAKCGRSTGANKSTGLARTSASRVLRIPVGP